MSTQWNQQLIRYTFLKVTECLEQNIRKKSIVKDHRVKKNEQSTKYSHWNMQIEI